MEVIDSCSSGDSSGDSTGIITTTTGITSLPSHIITSHILTKLDGPSLASISCSSRQFYALCLEEENLWKIICNTTFPSTSDPLVRNTISKFPSGHRSFYLDTFPTTHPRDEDEESKIKIKKVVPAEEYPYPTHELIYAVDVKFGDSLLYSKVVVTDITNSGFGSVFFFNLMWQEKAFPIPVKVEKGKTLYDEVLNARSDKVMKTLSEKLKISWIVIDPINKKAINLASPVVLRHVFSGGYINLEYPTVLELAGGDARYVVTVRCECRGGGELCVYGIDIRPRGMTTEGKIICWKNVYWDILQEAMKLGKRTRIDIGEEIKRYDCFLTTTIERTVKRVRQKEERQLLKKQKEKEKEKEKESENSSGSSHASELQYGHLPKRHRDVQCRQLQKRRRIGL